MLGLAVRGSTTDPFGPLAALSDGLGLFPGSFCPHFDGEPARRPLFHRSIAAGTLPAGIACNDFAAAHLVGTDLHEVVASRARASAYRIDQGPDGAIEDPLPAHWLVSG